MLGKRERERNRQRRKRGQSRIPATLQGNTTAAVDHTAMNLLLATVCSKWSSRLATLREP